MLRLLILAALTTISAFTAYHYLQGTEVNRVTVIHAERGPIENTISLTGRVINDRTVTLSALVNGQITEMKIHKGQQVKSGQVLARFDRREADAELERLNAEQRLAKEKLQQARTTLDRLLNMGSANIVSQQELDDAQTGWRIAAAQLDVAQAAYRIASIQREKYDVTAPFDGVITEKTTEVGQWLEAGTPLFTLVAEQGREIEVSIDSSDRGQVKLNQHARLSAEAWPVTWQESVQWLAPAVSQKDKETLNTFSARLSLGPDAPPLILGQQIDVELILDSKQDALYLPYSALITDDDKKQIAIVDEQSQIRLVVVTTGIEAVRHVEILKPEMTPEMRIAEPQELPFQAGQAVLVE